MVTGANPVTNITYLLITAVYLQPYNQYLCQCNTPVDWVLCLPSCSGKQTNSKLRLVLSQKSG